jgi:tetratricopeptide (TPR) repeat protein/transcriptional regulator with XRE-family HTH domain
VGSSRANGGRPLKPLDPNARGRARFGVALRNARTAAPGLRQRELAERLSVATGRVVGRSYIAKVELGELLPTFDFVRAAGTTLGCQGPLQAAWEQAVEEERMDRRTLISRVPVALAALTLGDRRGEPATAIQKPDVLDAELQAAIEDMRHAGDGLGRLGAGIAAHLDQVTARWRLLDDSHGAKEAGAGIAEHIETISALIPNAAHEQARNALLSARASAEQFAGWCSWEQRDLSAALRWSTKATRDAIQAGDRPLASYALARAVAYQLRSGHTSDAATSVQPIWRVAKRPDTPPLVASCLAATCANALAANGNALGALRASAWSRQAFDLHIENQAEVPGWIYFYTEAQMTEWLGRAAILLRRWDEAGSQLEACLAALRTGFPREAGVALTALAEVCVERGDLDRAEELARQALDVAERFGSARGVARLGGVLRRMRRTAPDAPVTRRLSERLKLAQQHPAL